MIMSTVRQTMTIRSGVVAAAFRIESLGMIARV
jgi:hypothetical protein